MKPKTHEQFIQQTFDSFCKKVLKYAARDYRREMKRLQERETPFSELSAREISALAVADEYFKDEHAFDVLGIAVNVTDCDLAEALNTLPADRRDIVLMSYFFDMTDREIAERLKMARRTVAHQRTSTLRELKKILESEE
jgi:RNA polymerase sigma factor (sigma-70 family)